jgi:dihydroneopterin aldolase
MDAVRLALRAEQAARIAELSAARSPAPQREGLPGLDALGHPARRMIEDWPLSEALGLRRLLDRAGTSTYRILVRDLVLPCSIGIYDYERQHRQRVRVNVELDIGDPGSFVQEDFSKVLNYEFVVEGIKAIVDSGHIELVETLAERIAALCLDDPRAERATVTVEKLDVYPESEGVGVTIVRRRPIGNAGLSA